MAIMSLTIKELVTSVVDWKTQKRDFARDGSLRDICVQGTTVEDWRIMLGLVIEGGNYEARLQRKGVDVSIPSNLLSLFDSTDRYLMGLSISDVTLECHFLEISALELSFRPETVTEASLKEILAFMVDLGNSTSKIVDLTPENSPTMPIFEYVPRGGKLRWIANS